MPDKESGCSSSSRQSPPSLRIDPAAYEYDNPSPTSDILLDAVAPREHIDQPENMIKTEDGMCILCDSPQPKYTAQKDHTGHPTEDGTLNVPEQGSMESHAEVSSRALTTDHDTSSNNTEPPELPIAGTSDRHEHIKISTSAPSSPHGAPPPYADPGRRRTSQERVEEPPRIKPRKVIGNFTLTNTLGAGSMGKVKLAVHNLTDEKLAVKIIPRAQAQQGNHKHLDKKDRSKEIRTIREASIMLLLHHPFIVSLKEMVVLNPYYYMFMEYVNGGQLLDYIISHGKLKEKHARRFARQILSALDYCHRNSIVHRDLKIENILISRSGHIKIIDFGLSNLFSPQSHLSTFCGSLYFAAPELLNAKLYTGPEVDLWSFGVVLYVLVCGRVPFDDQSMPALHAKIKRGQVEYPNYLSHDCKNLLQRLLVTDPARRAAMPEILMHPWTNKGYDTPVDNYLPHRPPLNLPIDMEVVRGMTGFEFGTEEDIRAQLEGIISTPEYQNAAKIKSRSSLDFINSGAYNKSHGLHASKKSFTIPNDDPQSIPAAYHPLISIYYLVKERMDRNRLMEQQDSLDVLMSQEDFSRRRQSRDILTGIPIPTISKPERAHPADLTYEQSILGTDEGDGLSGLAYGRRGRANIRLHPDGHILEIDGHSVGDKIEEGFNRLFSRRHNSQSHASTGDQSETDLGNENEHPGVFRRLSLALGKGESPSKKHERRSSFQKRAAEPTSPIPIPGTSPDLAAQHISRSTPEGSRKSHEQHSRGFNGFHLRAGDDKENNQSGALQHHSISGTKKFVSGKVPAQQLPGVEPNRNGMEYEAGPIPVLSRSASGAVSQRKQSDRRGSAYSYDRNDVNPGENGTVDQSIKPVFLKGLFSVSTTSTKHPSVIRADLIHVLERIGVKWRERKGRFECVHVPSIDLYGTKKPELQPVQEEEVANHTNGQTNDLTRTGASVGVPDLVVRFEIYIVKVPWLLGMHGLQFRRVGGDPWQYKNMCSKILNELKL